MIETIEPLPIEMELAGYCLDCRKQHVSVCHPDRMMHHMEEWRLKHIGHRVEFKTRQRRLIAGHKPSLYRKLMSRVDRLREAFRREPWWATFAHNANINIAYGSSSALTITLASLATSSTLLAGRQSTVVDNTSNLYLDYLIGGIITVGTTPTTLTKIEMHVFAAVNDTPTYPDSLGASDAAYTATNAEVKRCGLKLMKVSDVVSTTSNVGYWFPASSVAAMHGGVCPHKFGVAVFHNTGVNLNATGGNHVISAKPAYATAA